MANDCNKGLGIFHENEENVSFHEEERMEEGEVLFQLELGVIQVDGNATSNLILNESQNFIETINQSKLNLKESLNSESK